MSRLNCQVGLPALCIGKGKVVVVVEFFIKTLSNAKQTMKMQADNTGTQNEH